MAALTIIPATTSQAPQEFTYEGGSIIIEVYHTGTYPEPTVSDSWITCTWRTFTENGSEFTITVSQNDGSADRTGEVDFEHFLGDSGVFYIKQLWNDPTPALYVNPSTLYWDAQGGQKTFLVAGSAATSNLSFTTYPSWMTAPSLSSQGGGGYFYTTTAQSFTQDAPSDIYRGGTMAISDGNNHSTVANIVQGEVFAEPTEFNFGGLQTNDTLYVYYSGTLLINGSPDTPWLSISTRSSQPGFRTLNVTASQNNTGVSRSGYISLEDDYSDISVPVVQGPLGTVTISESRLAYTKEGGPETVHIAYTGLGASCRTDQNWLTVTSTSDDQTNKVLTAVVTASSNTGQVRTANFFAEPTDGVTSASISALQLGDAQVQTSVDPSSLTFTAAGETKTAEVTYAGTFGTPSISYNDGNGWLSVITANSGLRTKIASVTPSVNPSNNSRTATITFTGSSSGSADLSIFQAGAAALTVSPSRISYVADINPAGPWVDVTVDNIIGSVTTSKSGDWISLGTSSTSGTAELYPVMVSSNPGHSRSGYVTFTDDRDITKSVTVSQSGIADFTVEESILSFSSASGSQYDIISNYIYPVTASISGSWITVSGLPSSADRGYPKSISVAVSRNNTSSSRTGTVVLEDGDNQTVNIRVNQSAGTYQAFTVDPSYVILGRNDASSNKGYVTFSGDLTGLSCTSTPAWTSVSISTSYSRATWTAISFNSGTAREGTAYFTNGQNQTVSVAVKQAGEQELIADKNPVYLNVSGTVTNPTSRGEDFEIYNGGGIYSEISISDAPSWLHITHLAVTMGRGNHSFSVSADANTGTTRTATVTFREYNSSSQTYLGSVSATFTQEGSGQPTGTVSCSPSEFNYTAQGGVIPATVTWTAGTTPQWYIRYPEGGPSDWITQQGLHQPDISTLECDFMAASNSAFTSRSAELRISNTLEVLAVPITQAAAVMPTISVSPSSSSLGYSGGTISGVMVTTYGTSYQNPSVSGTWISCTQVSPFGEENEYYYDITVAANPSTTARNGSVTFTDSTGSAAISIAQAAAPAPGLSVSPDSLSFTSASGHQSVTVTNISGELSYTPSVDWVTVNESGSGGSRLLSVRVSENNTSVSRSGSLAIDDSRQNPVSVAITQEAGQAPIDTISFSPVSFTFNAVDTTQKILTVTHPDGWLNFDKNYQQGSGWLTVTLNEYVDNNTTKYNVYITDGYDNTGNARTCYLDFTSYSGATGRVVVTQQAGAAPPPASGDYIPVWRDYLYSPSGFTNGQDYAYSLRGSGGTVLYQGVTVAPDSSHTPDPINITRLVESYVNSGEFNYTSGSWKKLPGELTVNFYKVGQVGLVQQWLIWNDWSRYKLVYDSISTLNDPINFRACQGMKLPLCVYQKGTTSWSMTEVKKNGTSSTTSFSYPSSYKFAVYVPSYTSSAKRLDFKRGGNTQFSYDMTACGQGYFLYRNRFGGWDSFLIEGNIYKKEGYARQNYTSPVNTSYGYSVDRHTDKVNITTSYEVHTGWLTDQEAERLVYHLLSSPKVYFTSFEGDHYELGDMKEVILTGSQAEYKKYRNGRKLTSYTITFDASDTKRVQR